MVNITLSENWESVKIDTDAKNIDELLTNFAGFTEWLLLLFDDISKDDVETENVLYQSLIEVFNSCYEMHGLNKQITKTDINKN